VSSIRLFILSSFAERGPMHGHLLRVEAEQRHVTHWTDITVGAVYGAMKRLASEGLLRATVEEREGARPMRQVYEITAEGLSALAALRREELDNVWFRYDPFDLALTRMATEELDSLPQVLEARLAKLRAIQATRREHTEARAQKVAGAASFGLAKEWALRHTDYRLEAEVSYLEDLLAVAADIIADERQRREQGG
jgi:DNA-binding PadR family transcriptional regulator